MDHQQLRHDLRRLHDELRAIESLDQEEHKMLRLLESDIEELLARDEDNPRTARDSRQRLSQALAQVEASHPRVALLMRQMVDSLSYLGV